MKNRRFYAVFLLLFCQPFLLNGWGEETSSSPDKDATATAAWREEIITPHWGWPHTHTGGTVDALFLLNHRALRDAEELSQRFDIQATVVPTSGDDYKNSFDETFLQSELEKKHDVLVIAASLLFRDLSEPTQAALRKSVKAGLPVVFFRRGDPDPDFQNWLDEKDAANTSDTPAPSIEPLALESDEDREDMDVLEELDDSAKKAPPPHWIDWDHPEDWTGTVSRHLDMNILPFFKTFRVTAWKAENGRMVWAEPYDPFFVYFNAFLPAKLEADNADIIAEQAYLLAARIIRKAAGKQTASASNDFGVSITSDYKIKITNMPKGSDFPRTVRFDAYTPFGQHLHAWKVSLENSQKNTTIPLPPQLTYDNSLYVAYTLLENEKTRLHGIVPCVRPISVRFTKTGTTRPTTDHPKIDITWDIEGDSQPGDMVECQIYDPDRHLIAWQKIPANTTTTSIPTWQPRTSAHLLRYLYTRNKEILAEHRETIWMPLDRENDPRTFHTIIWSDELGSASERWRYYRLRELGITAAATIGKNPGRSFAAGQCGLRLVPTNIFVPKNRFSPKNYTVSKEKTNLDSLMKSIAPLDALGYSLADEPSGTDLLAWQQTGLSIIGNHDPEGRVGYCGLWVNARLPSLMQACPFLEPYSPQHLYDINLWRGIERDLYRSFRRKDGILSCWTQYAPWKDHEPYSRTAPWLWLFEEMNGVSFFSSSGSFALLKGDLRSTHETRWWNEEVQELHKGIAEQFIRMERESGEIRILFTGNMGAVTPWVRALNRMNIAYRIIDRSGLHTDDPAMRLLICPSVTELSEKDSTAINTLVQRGVHLIGIDGMGLFQNETPTPATHLSQLFGFTRTQQPKTPDEWNKVKNRLSGIRVSVLLDKQTIAGTSTGECILNPTEPKNAIHASHVGTGKTITQASAPEYMRPLFTAPMVIQKSHSKATTSYLGFLPNQESMPVFLNSIMKTANVTPASVQCLVDGKPDSRVYLFPFRDGDLRCIGIVADYMRIPASTRLMAEGSPVHTNGYFHHGDKQWAPLQGTIRFDQPGHIYDARAGRYLGRGKQIPLSIHPAHPGVVSHLPYKLERIELSCPETIMAGQEISITTTLIAKAAIPQAHVVHIALTDPNGKSVTTLSQNIHTKKGTGTHTFTLPHNAPTGNWTVTARDALTGMSSARSLHVMKSTSKATRPLATYTLITKRPPLSWPAGEWTPIDNAKTPEGQATCSTSGLKRLRMGKGAIGNCKEKMHLQGTATLQNSDVMYSLKYLACNDTKAFGWRDERRVYPVKYIGLGVSKPSPSFWNQGGFLQIKIGDCNVAEWRMERMVTVPTSNSARVDCVWDTPKGVVTLSSVVVADHPGLFQQLSVMPRDSLNTINMELRANPFGRTQGGREMVHIDAEHQSWVVLADARHDPAFYPNGNPPGALLLAPTDWTQRRFGRQTFLQKDLLEKRDTKKPVTFRWVLWVFPDKGNQEAVQYMQTTSADTAALLQTIFAEKGEAR